MSVNPRKPYMGQSFALRMGCGECLSARQARDQRWREHASEELHRLRGRKTVAETKK